MKARHRARTLLAGGLAFLVAAACVLIWARYRAWGYSLGCLLGVAAIALGIAAALAAGKGRRRLPVVVAALAGVAILASAAGAAYTSWLVMTGAVPPSAPGVSKPFVVVTGNSMMWWPQVSGDIIVWMDDRRAAPGKPIDRDIYGYDLSTKREFPICKAPGSQSFPRISGHIVVWTDKRQDTDIYGCDLSTHREFPICTAKGAQSEADISGDIVVWTDSARGWKESDIYGRDLATGRVFPICTAPGQQDRPAVSGHTVVWEDHRSLGAGSGGSAAREIDGYDLTTRREFRIGSAAGGGRPLIDGHTVVWGSSQMAGGLSAFTVVDLTTRKQRRVAITGESFTGPTGLSDGIVVLVDDDAPLLSSGGAQVWLYDMARARSSAVSTWGATYSASISGDLAVWFDGRDEGGSIKAVRLQR